MSKILVANWKMNPLTEGEAVALAKAADAPGVVICPPDIFIPAVAKVIKKASLGAQDGFYEPQGAFTGFVSMQQLAGMKAQYVIIGHSSRRALGEDETLIAKKVAAAFEAGLIPILCVGETHEQHAAGKKKEVVDRQIRGAFSLLPADMGASAREMYVTYEPVWAISANQAPGAAPVADSPQETLTIVRYLEGIMRGLPVSAKFLYGGSVGEDNVVAFLSHPELSGALVGGASLRSVEFKKIIKFVSVQ